MKKSLVFLGLALVLSTSAAVADPQNGGETNPQNVATTLFVGTPLCTAISKGDVAVVRKFIEYGANVNEKSNGMTPLMVAARYNNVEIIKLLVENGANVDAKNENGFTALKFAQLSNAADASAYLTSIAK
ncbi:MAG TPA: ankyrin repeat domain-containing protein [Flavobacterium sp.]|jgi:hypothetical protein